MVNSALWLPSGVTWARKAGSDAKLGDASSNHAEVKLHKNNTAAIKSASCAAFVQDAMPCDTCHKFFLQLSGAKDIIFVIGKGDKNRENGGTGYPIPAGVLITPIHVSITDDEEYLEKAGQQFELKKPVFPNSKALPVAMYYRLGKCYIGPTAPSGFVHSPSIEPLMNAA